MVFNKAFLVYNQIDFAPLTLVYNAFIYSPMLQNNEFEDSHAFQHYGYCGGGITVRLRSNSYNAKFSISSTNISLEQSVLIHDYGV